MDCPQWPPGFTSPPSQSLSPAALSTSPTSTSPAALSNSPASTSPAPAQPSTMASYLYPYSFNSHQQQVAERAMPMPVTSQPQSNNAGYFATSAPHTQTPAMGYPNFRYHSLQADNGRLGAANNVTLPVQQQNQQLQRFQMMQMQRFQQQQQQQLQNFMRWQKKQFLQQQMGQQQQQQQFPQPTVLQQQQYSQSQTPAALPNQNVSQIDCNNQNNQVNINQVGSNSPVGNNNQAGDSISHASQSASVATIDLSFGPGILPPLPPLLEPHPLTKRFEDLRILLHPIPEDVIGRLSMTTTSSLLRLCIDFEYRDLSADYPIALQLGTKAWLMRYLRELNTARRVSGLRLCSHWQKHVHSRHRMNPMTGQYEWLPETEVPGGTEGELKMLDDEARQRLGNVAPPVEDNKTVVIPLIHPDWRFLQLRQVRGPSAKEYEDVVVDDIGELRRQKENADREQRAKEEALNNQPNDDGEVAIVGSRMLSDDEMRLVAEQRAANAAGPSLQHKRQPSKNIAAGSAKPKKTPMKPKGQQKQHGRKKSLVAAKDKVANQPGADNLQQTPAPPPLPDYPDDYGTGNMATQRDKYSQVPVGTSPTTSASVVASHNNAATVAPPSNNTSAQSTSQLPDYPDIYGPATESINQHTCAGGPNTLTSAVNTTNTSTSALPDYPPMYSNESTNQHNPAGAGPNTLTSAIITADTSASAVSDYPPVYAAESTAESTSISPSIQPAVSEADTTAADPLPQVDGGFDPEDDGLDDLFEGELDD